MTSGSENSFLNADGGRNTANQKLMIVDQSTGEISFVKKSLSGINQNFTKEDNEIKEALKLILGNNLKGDTSGFIKTLTDSIATAATTAGTTYATKTESKAIEDDIKDFKGSNSMTALRATLDNKISNGARIDIRIGGPGGHNKNTHRLCDDRGDNTMDGDEEKARFCKLTQFGNNTNRKYVMPDIRILKV